VEATRTMFTKNTEANFARSVDVRVETTTAVVSGQAFHGWRVDRIGGTDFGLELEETKLVRCIRRTDDQTAHSTDVVLEVGDGKC
jgi:hypothetical protein